MMSEKEIQEWWNIKIENYLKKYSRRNKLTLTQARKKFFTETNKNFLEIVPPNSKYFYKSFMTRIKYHDNMLLVQKLKKVVKQTYLNGLRR